jgi:hypothetical protein
MPSVQRGSGRRDPPETPPLPSLLQNSSSTFTSQVLVATDFDSVSLKQQPWWSDNVRRWKTQVSKGEERRRHLI